MSSVRQEEPRNGSYVTWRELGLKVDPIEKKLDDAITTLNGIATNINMQDGASRAAKGFIESKRFFITCVLLVLCSSAAATVVTILLRGHP